MVYIYMVVFLVRNK